MKATMKLTQAPASSLHIINHSTGPQGKIQSVREEMTLDAIRLGDGTRGHQALVVSQQLRLRHLCNDSEGQSATIKDIINGGSD